MIKNLAKVALVTVVKELAKGVGKKLVTKKHPSKRRSYYRGH